MPEGGLASFESMRKGESKIDGLKGMVENSTEIATSLNEEKIQALKIKYKIGGGDNLGKIAKGFGTTVDKLAQDNNITNKDLIFEGKNLEINIPEKGNEKPSGGESTEPQLRLLGSQNFGNAETVPIKLKFSEKYTNADKELEKINTTIKDLIKDGKKFTKEQQKIAHKEFKSMEEEINSEKTKLTIPDEIAKADELFKKLTDIKNLYDSNVVTENDEVDTLQPKANQPEIKSPDLKTKIGNTLNSINTPTSLVDGNPDGIKFDKGSQKLTLGDQEYDVKLAYNGVNLKLTDAIIDSNNVTFKVNVPFFGEKNTGLPKNQIISMIGELIDKGNVSQSTGGGSLEISKVS